MENNLSGFYLTQSSLKLFLQVQKVSETELVNIRLHKIPAKDNVRYNDFREERTT